MEDCAAHLPCDLFATGIGQQQARHSAKDTAKERGAVSGVVMLARDESIRWERLPFRAAYLAQDRIPGRSNPQVRWVPGRRGRLTARCVADVCTL